MEHIKAIGIGSVEYMALFNKKDRSDDYYAQAMAVEMTPSQKYSPDRIRDKMIRTWKEPVIPRLERILLISMIVLTTAMELAEVVNYTRYREIYGPGLLLSNMAVTGIIIWSIYSVLLIVTSCLGMHFNRVGYYRKKQESGITDETAEEAARSKRALARLNKPCLTNIRVCLTGFTVWLLFLLVTRLV